ncbi:hypothetical protein DN069_20985 [Streptacidiphilus pinicola]|uniref:Calcium-binding protein n=1 Tax=Streptacidiphilus pinicola TaxID=2219663 RepID=A0A2X0K2Z4_9ACTN|nr:hypothetical protein [Streptacidiphilus pinicola]RAG83635.1 hypothetical protein DN069_20985 [Streptacidiphilus pinicola]
MTVIAALACLLGVGVGPAQASAAKSGTWIGLRASASTVDYGGLVTLTAHLAATHSSRFVTIYASPPITGPVYVLASGNVDSHGLFKATVRATGLLNVYARFAGDSGTWPATSTEVWVNVRAVLHQKLTGQYRTVTLHGGPYAVFHHATTPVDVITAVPAVWVYSVSPLVQKFWAGTWHTDSHYGNRWLNGKPVKDVRLDQGFTVGGLYRVSVGSITQEDAIVPGQTSWLYFTVTK